MRENRTIAVVGTGVLGGLLSGLFGVGGGIVMVPALVYFVGLDQRRAHGTSLAAVVPLSISSGLSYALADKVDWKMAFILALGSMAGAWFGTRLLRLIEPRMLGSLFGVLLLATSVRLAIGGVDEGVHRALSPPVMIALILGGLFAGVMAGLLGVGGGAVLVPMMIVGLGMPTAMSKGTSLVVIVVTSVVGTLENRRHSNVDLPVAATVGVAGVISAFLGGQVSLGISGRVADRLFAGLLLVVAVKMFWDLYSKRS